MATVESVLVIAACAVLAFACLLFLIARDARTGQKAASRLEPMGRRAPANGQTAHPVENQEQKEALRDEGALKQIYDYFA